MKSHTMHGTRYLLSIVLFYIASTGIVYSQVREDTLNLPQIGITSLNGYGPYVLGTERTNLFVLYQLPTHTSQVIMKMIDSRGEQINNAYTESGSDLETVTWSFESDTMGLRLSPQLYIEIHYQGDSTAIYKIPYTVYPDTVYIEASEGFGPFFTNNYTYTDTLWQPVPELLNTFKVSHLPPRTDTIEFQIASVDSTIYDSLIVIAPEGNYLDSAIYPDVRMDELPLDAKYLRTIIWCEGGPREGLAFHKELTAIPQHPRLVCYSDGEIWADSIGVFVQNKVSGQSLAIDSIKYAMIQNGPGKWDLDNAVHTIYRGPYSLDIMQSNYTIEAWMYFDIDVETIDVEGMNLFQVDSAWNLYVEANSVGTRFSLTSLVDTSDRELWGVVLDTGQWQGEGWHHLAFSCSYDFSSYPTGKFYLDGHPLPGVIFDQSNYDFIIDYYNWRQHLGTQPLVLGCGNADCSSLVKAMDEVRIWSEALSEEEIWKYYSTSPLQSYGLAGYWNFDDLRNRLNIISDKSFNNNMGQLKNNAYFLPQHPGVQQTMDTLKIISSNIETDSVRFIFLDRDNDTVAALTKLTEQGITQLVYDVASLPYTIDRLKICEYYFPVADTGFNTDYTLNSLAPPPFATPQYNWNKYFYLPENYGKTFAPVTVSGLPDNTWKVTLGLKNEDSLYDTVSYTANSIPYQHSIFLNGTDNFIKTTEQISAPGTFTIMFWVKCTTGKGGRIMGFSDSQDGSVAGKHDREVVMDDDGSLKFNVLSEGTISTLYSLSINNDGEWHHVAVSMEEGQGAAIYVDGSLSQRLAVQQLDTYQGWWIIGKSALGLDEKKPLTGYFQGSLSEISVWNKPLDYTEINSYRYQTDPNPNQVLHYKLDEGTGNSVTDYAGSNSGTVEGSTVSWFTSNSLSYLVWNKSLIAHPAGTYTFFADVYYPASPQGGAEYELGNFLVETQDPTDSVYFHLSEGQGYFSQGISLINTLTYKTYYDGSGESDWSSNYARYSFFNASHELISSDSVLYTEVPNAGQFEIDMGDAPPDSYISFEIGYKDTQGYDHFQNSASLPIYIHPLIPPRVNGNFGPYLQPIAPGSMSQPGTLSIRMEPINDLDSIAVKFYDTHNHFLGDTIAMKVSDTLWTVSYDMSLLAPPYSNMKLEYYLGSNPEAAAIEGPYPISIQKTRPRWFDFLPDTAFTNVDESGDVVTFKVTTPFEKNWLINGYEEVSIPYWVPLLGGSRGKMKSPTAEASLKYTVSKAKLELNQAPKFYQGLVQFGAGNTSYIMFDFNMSQNNSYQLDNQNELIASQNFAIGGGAGKDLFEIENMAKKVGELLDISSVVEPGSFVIKPSFKIAVKGDFEYASRQHLKVDTTNGKWGSFGDLHIDANPSHTEAFRKSASYHFYSGAFGLEFSIGVKYLEGTISAYFGMNGRVVIGYGHSNISIPDNDTRKLKSAAFQTYGRIYVDVLWGWYEKNLWGPKMFYSDNFWGDDMSPCFPPMKKPGEELDYISANSSWPELGSEIVPVSWFTKMPPPAPHQKLASSSINNVVCWEEKGTQYGERDLTMAYFSKVTRKFSGKNMIEVNQHALNNPVSDAINDEQVILSWAQTRHDNKSISAIKPSDVLEEFVRAQDIWFAVYDIAKDTVVQAEMILDDTRSLTSGRAEANPQIAVLSDTRAMITWQVVDLDNHTSEIWYVILEKVGDRWTVSDPGVVTDMEGVESDLRLQNSGEDQAVLVWMNVSGDLPDERVLMSSYFDGNDWDTPSRAITLNNEQFCNYFDIQFKGNRGAAVLSIYSEDPAVHFEENLVLIPWDNDKKAWDEELQTHLFSEPKKHIQLPRIAINDDGSATIAVKLERMGQKEVDGMISQVDLIVGNLDDLAGPWGHFPANELVCDTTKQLEELALAYIGQDTLMLLSNEFPMTVFNTAFEAKNGIFFGNPEMNLILRCFSVNENGSIEDVDENNYFLGIGEAPQAVIKTSSLMNYPNPCRESTTLKFEVSNRADSKLELIDLMGNKTATILDQGLVPGSYQMQLNTALLKPGIYYCKLTNGPVSETIKIDVIH